MREFEASNNNYSLSVRVKGEVASVVDSLDLQNVPTYSEDRHIQRGSVNAIIVTDVDFLEDQFWVNVKEYFGEDLLTPFANNATFIVNALENLSDSSTRLLLYALEVLWTVRLY